MKSKVLTTRGVPHSIQALDDGVEFLLVFDDGDFSEDNTFLASEVFLHTPVSSQRQSRMVPNLLTSYTEGGSFKEFRSRHISL
jgi:hypothetical protein